MTFDDEGLLLKKDVSDPNWTEGTAEKNDFYKKNIFIAFKWPFSVIYYFFF